MGKSSKKGKADSKKAKRKVEKLFRKKAAKAAKAAKGAKPSKAAARSAAQSGAEVAVDIAAKAAGAAAQIASEVASNATEALVKRGAKLLAKTDKQLTVGGLEASLLKLFPVDTAESWDRTGLLVGDRSQVVEKVAVTLDPTVDAIEEAARSGANVLLTHHPAYLHAPVSFAPGRSVADDPGAGVWAAIRNGVALIDFHTALDVSRQAQAILPNLLGLAYEGRVLAPLGGGRALGYGQVCSVSSKEGSVQSLAHLAARCTSVFGRAPRVWGPLEANVKRVVTATGSASDLGHRALEADIDCLICGEVRYHDALELAGAGLCIIELGHDVSEFPLTAVLADAVTAYGVDGSDVIILDQTENWAYPESIRL